MRKLSGSCLLLLAVSVAQADEPRGERAVDATRTNPTQAPAGVDRTATAERDTATAPAAGQSNANQPGAGLEAHIANCLVLGNQGEVALSRWALERTQNPQTKQFAQMLIDDHSQMLTQIQPYASLSAESARGAAGTTEQPGQARRQADTGANRTQPADANRQAGDTARQPDSRTSSVAAQGGDMHNQFLAIEQRAAAECLQLTQQDLAKHEGTPDFDQAFVGVQIGMHNHMLAKLRAIEPHVNGEFQALVQKAAQSATAHKQQAEQLMEQLASAEGSNRRATDSRTAAPATRPAPTTAPATPNR